MFARTRKKNKHDKQEIELLKSRMEKEGEPLLFDYENYMERKHKADGYLEFMCKVSKTRATREMVIPRRDKYFRELEQQRKSPYYKEIAAKVEKGERVHPGEFLYYALVTDKVNELDPKHLSAVWHYDPWVFGNNIGLLSAIREWQKALDPFKKMKKKETLQRVFQGHDTRTYYVNLQGVDFSGADLSFANLNDANLKNANFEKANLYSANMNYSCLNGANLSNTVYFRPDIPQMVDGLHLSHSVAHNARFENIVVPNICWNESDFTGSSFKGSTIGYGCFDKSIFDNCDFTGGILSFNRAYATNSLSLQGANLVEAKLSDIYYYNTNFTGAKLFPVDDLRDPVRLGALLDKLKIEVIQKIKDEKSSEWYTKDQIEAYQKIVATNLVEFVAGSSLAQDKKLELLNVALGHPMFQPDSYHQQKVNTVANYATSAIGMFATVPVEYQVQLFKTDAICILQEERERIVNAENSVRPSL